MKFRRLGNSGLKVSVIGLGTNQFGGKVDQAAVNGILDSCLEKGINLIDTANIYQKGRSEETLGKALTGRREDFIIATKFRHSVGDGPNDQGGSRYHIIQSVEASLRRLNTDYIDLYQIHRWDPETPIEETLRALTALVQTGKVRYIGASNFAAWQLILANKTAEISGLEPFISIQSHYHLFERGIESELIPACIHEDIGILPYFPLAGGFLTGKYEPDQPAPPGSRGETSPYVQRYLKTEYYEKLVDLREFARANDRSMVELAHAWLLAQPNICSVISGVTRAEHVSANASAWDWELSPEKLQEIEAILGNNF